MGIDTKLYVSKKWNNRDLADLIHNTIKLKFPKAIKPRVHIPEMDCGDHFFLYYNRDEVGIGQIMISNSEIGGIESMLLMAGAGDDEIDLFKTIGEKIGGVFTEDDCSGSYEYFQGNEFSSMEFVLKQAFIGGPSYDTNNEHYNRYLDEAIEELKKMKK